MKQIILPLAISVALVGCNSTDPNVRAKRAAAVGAVAGAVIGHQVSHDNGKYVGAVVGGLAGAGIGNYMDRQHQELEAALERENQQNVEIQRLKDNSIQLDIPSEVSFDFDSAEINSGFRPTLDQIGTILNRYPETQISVIGYTDSLGSESYNQELSLRRGESVKNYLTNQGVSNYRITATGRGESQPRASNETEAGRQLNRRVEIIIQPQSPA